MNPEAPEWPQRLLVTNNDGSLSGSNQSGALSSPSERAFHEMLELHQHQNALQRQQNMLATQQKKSSLPHPKVPIFDGSPMEYGLFIRAFENIIESKTSSSSERLYYLEQCLEVLLKTRSPSWIGETAVCRKDLLRKEAENLVLLHWWEVARMHLPALHPLVVHPLQ